MVNLYQMPEKSKFRNIVCYLRKSRKDEDLERRTGEDTLSLQRDVMQRLLAEYPVDYALKEEVGSGDSIDSRPIFSNLLSEIDSGKWDAVAVKEISRLGRGNMTDMGRIFDSLYNNRVYIITPTYIYNPRNPADQRIIRFELFFAKEEYEMIKERMVSAKYTLAMQGKWVAGSVPFGYKYNNRTRKLEPYEEEAKVVRLIYELYVYKDMGYHRIATFLRQNGIPTPKGNQRWQPQVIRTILEKEVYAGHTRFRVTERVGKRVIRRPEEEHIFVLNAHEPIVDDDLWFAVQKKREDYKAKPKTPVNIDFSPCELASIVTCNKCGKKMVRQYNVQRYTKSDGEISIYEKEFLKCLCGVYVKYRDVEMSLLSTLETVSVDDMRLKKGAIEALNRKTAKSSYDPNELIKQLLKQKEQCEKRITNASNALLDGLFGKEEYNRAVQENKAQINNITKQIESLESELHQRQEIDVDVEGIRRKFETILFTYHQLSDKSRKNELLRNIFDHVELRITEKGRGSRSSKFDVAVVINFDILV